MKTMSRVYILWSVYSAVLLSIVKLEPQMYESTLRPFRGQKIFKLDTGTLSKPRSSMKSSSSQHIQEIQQLQLPTSRQSYVQSDLPDVSVSCSASGLVLRVRTSFYGRGASKEDLTLGATCRSNGVLGPYGDLLFTYPLMECDGQREMRPGYIVYKFVLHYVPSPHLDVDIECRFQRYHHVYQLAVRPTWHAPTLRKTLKGRLNDFHIQLMDDSWTYPASSQVYYLGEPVNIQVSASYLPSGGVLYIRRCHAALSTGSTPSQKYTIIDNVGCLLESQRDPAVSQFFSPRTNDTLRFSISAFQFTSDPGSQVIIHCKLFVTSGDPSPARKSCTYRDNGWSALTGDDSICECCDSKCVTSKTRRAMIGSASSGPLLVSDQPASQEDGVTPSSSSLVSSSVEDRELGEDVLDFEMKTTRIQELQASPEDLWGDADVAKDDSDGDEPSSADLEEEELLATQIGDGGAPLEPVLDTLGFTSWLMEERGVMKEKGVLEERDVMEEDVMDEEEEREDEDRDVVEEEKDVIEEERGVMEKQRDVMDLEFFRGDDSGHSELDGSGHITLEESSEGRDELGSQGKRSEMSEARVEQEEAFGERRTAHLQNERERDPHGEGIWETMTSAAKGDSQLSEKQGLNMKQPLGNQSADDQMELYTAGSEEAQRTEWEEEEDRVSSEGLVETGVLNGKQMTWLFTWS